MPAPQTILDLIQRFTEQRAAYKAGKYNETQLRRDFLDPFFEALGWDVSNRNNYAERYREVIHEASVEVDGAAKAADYAFRVGEKTIFFVEAKKPAVNIETSLDGAFQARRYGWSAKVPVAVLTDFEQLAIYDCRLKPKHGDSPSVNRVRMLSYQQYAEQWDDIAGILSRQAVLKGSFDQFVESSRAKKGTADVDDDFLAEMERWREELARNIALRNPGLDSRAINFAVQTTIDRIIFLRICEDRGMEAENALRDATDGIDVYGDLLQLFRQADRKYNSGLFHFSAEKGQSSRPDALTPTLKIDDKVLKDILAHLYYPLSPYAFRYISADILGQVYERFLGKVIRLTGGHQARVEEKPEVRKAGGVYYTPTYIVRYIVEHTLGRLLSESSPAEQEKRPLRVLDPACGSGSFLLGAYQHLLDWYLDWYSANEPAKHARGKNPPIMETSGGWQLTMEKKKQILLEHIYGVDIDAQAVEVTKLSLLLKVVETPGQLSLLSERILPDLGGNIRCGNSLIGPDYYAGHQAALFGDEEAYRVNAFDWPAAFPQVFAAGGFDAVIGNPPYGAQVSNEIKHYLSDKYQVPVPIADSFLLFMLQSMKILRYGGLQSFIVPSTWLYMPSFQKIRKYLLQNYKAEEIMLFRQSVFAKVVVETCIEIFSKEASKGRTFKFTEVSGNPESIGGLSKEIVQEDILKADQSNLLQNNDDQSNVLFEKLATENTPLGELTNAVCGLTPYRKGKGTPPQNDAIVNARAFDSDYRKNDTYRQYIMGRDFHRYSWQIQEQRWISYGDWLAEPRYLAPFNDAKKIVVRQTADTIIANLDANKYLSLKNVHNIRVTKPLSEEYFLGLLNSKLITWWYQCLIPEKGRVFAEVKVVNLKKIPIRTIDFTNPAEVKLHERMVELVQSMLGLHARLGQAMPPHEEEVLRRRIQATDRAIDALVYELYGLTEEEIKVVEG